jgi:chromosome partitioning protein
MITTVINSFKGGTAKTSTALHLGAALAKFHKKRVLLIDLDSQANLSSGLGFGCDCLDTMVPVLQGSHPIESVIKKSSVANLYLIPGNTFLDGLEKTHPLASDCYSHERLRKAIKPLDFDYCIIDVPPSLSWLTQSAHFAADQSIIASVPEPYSVLALNRLAKFHNTISENHPIALLGVLLSLWDARNATNEIFVEGIQEVFPNKLFKTRIRKDISVSRAIMQGKPVFDTFPRSKIVADYKSLAEEFLQRTTQK